MRSIPAKSVLFRIHRRDRDPIFWGPPSITPVPRFDDPRGEYKVCYLGEQREAALVETLLRNPGSCLLAWSNIEARQLTEIEVVRDLRLVEFSGPGLRRLGATAEVAATRDYPLSWSWSRTLWKHPEEPDGILYRCRHDDSLRGVALWDRARKKISPRQSYALPLMARWLGAMAGRYGFGLTL